MATITPVLWKYKENNDGHAPIYLLFSFYCAGIRIEKNYYVQFAAEKGDVELYAEAVGNEYLARSHALGDEQKDRLRASVGVWHKKHPESRIVSRSRIDTEAE